MAIYEGSRYAGAPVIRTKAADGRVRPTIYAMAAGEPVGYYRNHIFEAGDRLDLIANRLWGDPELWWRIANMNPSIFFPTEIAPGTVLRIPV